MYHQLASTKEVMKKDIVILEKKYRRSQQKIKTYDNELKQTRTQVATFKHRYKQLTELITKKGGIEVLNDLPNSPEYTARRAVHGAQKNEVEDFWTNYLNRGPADGSVIAQGSLDGSMLGGVKKSIRGGQQSALAAAKPVIRGGMRASTASVNQFNLSSTDNQPSKEDQDHLFVQQDQEEKKLNQSSSSIPPSN